MGCLVVQALLSAWLLFVGFGARRGAVPLDAHRETRTLIVLVAFVTVVVSVLLILEAERAAERNKIEERVGPPPAADRAQWWRATRRRHALEKPAGWSALLFSFASVGALLAAVTWESAQVLVAAPAVAGFVATVVLVKRMPRATKAPEPGTPAQHHVATPVPAQRAAAVADPPLVLAFSGGGIRASAFSLGAYNALQQRRAMPEPALVAVSGGSYLAASIALVRRRAVHAADGTSTEHRVDWRQAYQVGSPEVSRLRRHTRDLVEPGTALVGGVLTLLVGAAINVLIVLGALRLVALLSGTLYATAGMLYTRCTSDANGTPYPKLTKDEPCSRSLVLHVLPGSWRDGQTWGILAPAGLSVVLLIFTTISIWAKDRQADDGKRLPSSHDRLSAWRRRSVATLMGWLGAFVALPALLFGLSSASLENTPTTAVAGVMSSVGLTQEHLCGDYAYRDLIRAWKRAAQAAQVNPGQPQSDEGGSCGSSQRVTVVTANDGSVPKKPPEALDDAARSLRGGGSPALWRQLGAVVALLPTLLAALRLGGSGAGADVLAVTDTGFATRVRRAVLAWLPVTVTALVATTLFAIWTLQVTLVGERRHELWQILVPLAALAAVVWFDANTTALHSYYRQRLFSAFAVGRLTGDRELVSELPSRQEYAFSHLAPVQLNVVTTANVNAYDEVPTRRGGLPFVFSSTDMRLVTTAEEYSLPAAQYERASGAGRTSVMAAVAMSGAAFSPLAGRFAATVAPYRILLTLANLRIGCWVRNPAWLCDCDYEVDCIATVGDFFRNWPRQSWLIGRPGAAQALVEAAGRSSASDRWLYLSDGGHLDNTGLVEALRLTRASSGRDLRGRVLVTDASNDATGTWSAIGDALAVVRADLNIELVRVPVDAPSLPVGTKAPTRRRRALSLRQTPQGEGDGDQMDVVRRYRGTGDHHGLDVLVIKAARPAVTEDLPEPVRAFALTHPDFPRASTLRQDFGDLEFEAYRALGEHYARQALGAWR